MSLRLYRFRVNRWLRRTFLCRFGWHVGGNLAWNTEDGHYLSRCLWCEREMQWLGGEWREYIRPPRPNISMRRKP